METHPIQMKLRDRLSELSKNCYLLLTAVDLLSKTDSAEVTEMIGDSVVRYIKDGENTDASSFKMTASEVRQRIPALPRFVVDTLLVSLDALAHDTLAAHHGRPSFEEAPAFEADVAALWPHKDGLRENAWAYRDLILLAELRNAIVHRDGIWDPFSRAATVNRLRAAGADDEYIRAARLSSRGIDVFLDMKSAVRTGLNMCLTA